jgi:hypothetical protein
MAFAEMIAVFLALPPFNPLASVGRKRRLAAAGSIA